MTIIERVFHLLSISELNQATFCRKAGISPKTLTTWKSRKTDPPAALLPSIAETFNVSIDYLLNGVEPDDEVHMSPDDVELVANFNKLDHRGKCRVTTAIFEELDRVVGSDTLRRVPFAALGGDQITKEKDAFIQEKLREFEALNSQGGQY